MVLNTKTKNVLKKYLPGYGAEILRKLKFSILKYKYRYFGRPATKLETAKAKNRRWREDFFSKYCNGKGLDIGYGGDLLTNDCLGWDYEHGDAQYLKAILDGSFDFVYSGHTLEHMVDAVAALKNWWRVIKPGGYMILYLPHRDLFEKKKTLPSQWNDDHKRFFLLDRDEDPDTIGVIPLIARTLSGYEIEYAKICDEGYVNYGPHQHSDGEYSIEVVLKKNVW